MKCAYHPEADALGTCVKCGKPVCEICRVDVAGKTYCKNCVVKEIEERNPHLLATILGYIFGFFGGLLGIVFGIYLLTKEHPNQIPRKNSTCNYGNYDGLLDLDGDPWLLKCRYIRERKILK